MGTPEQPDKFDQENATDVGSLLKAARLKTGEDLHDIASIIRISYTYLEAIEGGRFEDLPGATYSLGFVRAYSEHLGLESLEITRRLKSQTSVSSARSELVFPKPIPEVFMPAGAIIFIGIIISILAYGAWNISSTKDGYFTEMISSLPQRLSKPYEQIKTVEKTKFEKQNLAKIGLKKEAILGENVNVRSLQGIAESISKPEPAQQSNLEKSPKQVVKQESVQQPNAVEAPKQVAELLAESILSRSVISDKSTESNIKREPEFTSSTAPRSTKIKVPENSLGPSLSQISKPDPETFNLPNPKLIPVIEVEVAPTTAPTVAVDPVRKSSIVPMDLIPAATPLLTGDGGQMKPASSSNSILQSASDLVSNETETPSLPKQELLEASAIEDVASIIIKAKTTSWIQVRDDIANEILLTQLLREGDSYTVPKRAGLMLSTGNAGALTILVDGETVPSIGGIGDVIRTVLLDGVRLKMGTAVSE